MTQYEYLVEKLKDPSDECMLWPFKLHADGYGKVAYFGAHRVHRLAFRLANPGVDITGLHIGHSSRCVSLGPSEGIKCFNPRHLTALTPQENEKQKWSDGGFTVCQFMPRSETNYKGVSVEKRWSVPRYRAYITVNYKRINLGTYDTAEKAARIYDNAVKHYRPDIKNSFLNFPDEA